RAGRAGGTRARAPPAVAPRLPSPVLCDRLHVHRPRPVRLRAVDRRHEVTRDPQRLVDLVLDLLGHLGVLVEVALGVAAALPEPLVAVGEERPRLGHDVVLDAEVEQAARRRDPPAERHVELRLPERRGDLVLDHLHPDAVAQRLGAVLERLDAADVQALRRVELQRAPAGLSLGGVVDDDTACDVAVVAIDLEVVAVTTVAILAGRRLAKFANYLHRGWPQARALGERGPKVALLGVPREVPALAR